jgi:hypothetical protein
MSRRPKRVSGRRAWRPWRPWTPAGEDPGNLWAAEILGPLRRRTIECDVAPRVMARLAAERQGLRRADLSPRASRLAWASSILLACAALAFLGSTLVVLILGGDEGVRQLAGLGHSGWNVLQVFGRVLAQLAAGVLSVAMPFLRAFWTLAGITAPLLRGAGLLAAAGGLLSILFSTYVFASARRTAPRVNFQGGIR